MIVDTDNRLGAAVHDLRDLIVGFTSPSSLFLPSSPFHYPFSLSYTQQAQSKNDPALSEAQELLNAEEEMEAATL